MPLVASAWPLQATTSIFPGVFVERGTTVMRIIFAALLGFGALVFVGCTDYEKLDLEVGSQERVGEHTRVAVVVTNARGEAPIDVGVDGVSALASDNHLYSALSSEDCPTCESNLDGTSVAVGEKAWRYLHFAVPTDVDLAYIFVTDNAFVSGDADSESRSRYLVRPIASDSQPETTVLCEVRIVARRLDDARTEFALQQRQPDGEWGDRILPRSRFFPADPGHSRWLSSSPIECSPTPSQGDLESS